MRARCSLCRRINARTSRYLHLGYLTQPLDLEGSTAKLHTRLAKGEKHNRKPSRESQRDPQSVKVPRASVNAKGFRVSVTLRSARKWCFERRRSGDSSTQTGGRHRAGCARANGLLSLPPAEALRRIQDPAFDLTDDAAVLAVLLHVRCEPIRSLSDHVIRRLAAWLWSRPLALVAVVLGIVDTNEPSAVGLLERIVDLAPQHVAVAVNAAGLLSPEPSGALLMRIARDPRVSVRQHMFTLLGKHQQLPPPGTLSTLQLLNPRVAEILDVGIRDESAEVRARAIAAAYGCGAFQLVQRSIMSAAHDPDMDVRMYALVALGVATDEASRTLLVDALERGAQEEVTSAIWALARRPDGIQRVVALIGDQRPWVMSEVTGAIAEVSAPLTDEQLAAVGSWASGPDEMRDVRATYRADAARGARTRARRRFS